MNVLKMLRLDDAASLMQIGRRDMEALVRSGAVKAFNLGSESAPRYFLRRESLMDYVCKGEKDFSRDDRRKNAFSALRAGTGSPRMPPK